MDADRLHPFLYLLIRSHMGSQDVHHVCQLSVRSLEIVVSVFSSGITFRKESDKLVFISCFEITWFFSVRVDLAIIVRNGIAIRDGRDVAYFLQRPVLPARFQHVPTLKVFDQERVMIL